MYLMVLTIEMLEKVLLFNVYVDQGRCFFRNFRNSVSMLQMFLVCVWVGCKILYVFIYLFFLISNGSFIEQHKDESTTRDETSNHKMQG